MPRRRRAFIDRAKAHTYEVVYRPLRDVTGSERVLRVVDRGNSSTVPDPAGDDLAYDNEHVEELSYERSIFELGEHDLPNDGYNYSKHFKQIGGKGGVFISAENPSGVKPPSSKQFELRGSDDEAEGEKPVSAMTEADENNRRKAIEEIQQDRKLDPMVDEVFLLLDSDGELDEEEEPDLDDNGADTSSVAAEEDMSSDGGEFPDDFVLLATGKTPSDPAAAIAEDTAAEQQQPSRRPRRLLDDEFERLMQSYADGDSEDGSADEEDPHARFNADDLSSTDAGSEGELEVETGLDDAAVLALLGVEGYTLDRGAEGGANDSGAGANDTGAGAPASGAGGADGFQPEAHAAAQLDSAMDELMDSYRRVPADVAFAALDGAAHARRAVAAAEAAERARLARKGAEADSSSDDEELDVMLDDMAEEDRERWDCETIVSTYSNLENHPSVIDDADGARPRRPRRALPPVIRLDPRTQIPVAGPYAPAASPRAGEGRDFGTRRPPARPPGKRSKNETREEKRARKEATKEAKRASRLRKSEMKRAFAEETLVQNRHAVGLGKSKVAVQL